ncbi:potassium channel, sub T, member 2 [Thoreauomyces humboldtii]|nr:potassium channel, sub T, member 2 [Thoreauomyces humboldtii]
MSRPSNSSTRIVKKNMPPGRDAHDELPMNALGVPVYQDSDGARSTDPLTAPSDTDSQNDSLRQGPSSPHRSVGGKAFTPSVTFSGQSSPPDEGTLPLPVQHQRPMVRRHVTHHAPGMHRSSSMDASNSALSASRLSDFASLPHLPMERTWTGRTLAHQSLLDCLDPNAPEVMATDKSFLLRIKHYFSGHGENSFADIRANYDIQRQQGRNTAKASNFIAAWLFSVFIAREYRGKLRLAIRHRLLLALATDLIVDLLFCFVYLVEQQTNYVSFDYGELSPQWLYIPRPRPIFDLCLAFSIYNIWSCLIKIFTADSKREAILNYRVALDVIISVPFIVLAIVGGTALQVYVPYFIRAVIVVSRIGNLLRLRGTWAWLRVDLYTERLILLVSTILALVYVAACAFQYSENKFTTTSEVVDGQDISLITAFYFVVITASTVGYGDVSPQSIPGKVVVVVFIVLAIAVLPNLISQVMETIQLRAAGGGVFQRGTRPFVVVAGAFEHATMVTDVMNTFFHRDPSQQTNVVFLGRTPPTRAIKAILRQSSFQYRAAYLQGSGLDVQDMERVQLQYAAAAFIVADRNAPDKTLEDDQNTLRAWSFDDFAPLTPLYVYNLLSDTEAFQEHTCNASVCIEDLKQVLLGYNALYKGAGTLMLNLLVQTKPMDSYDEPWLAQYGDGCGNEIYSTPVNPVFVGKSFQHTSFYLYREYQVICFGVRVMLKNRGDSHLMLNPGSAYTIGPFDQLFYIAQQQSTVAAIEKLTAEEYEQSIKTAVHQSGSFTLSQTSVRRPRYPVNLLDDPLAADPFAEGPDGGIHIGTPSTPFSDVKVPLCRLLLTPVVSLTHASLADVSNLTGHILICTGNHDLFRLICTLRLAHLTDHEFKRVVILCPNEPTVQEFSALAQFPLLYFVLGDPRKRSDLHRAGVEGSAKIIILNLYKNVEEEADEKDESFADSSAIMVSHMIYTMFVKSPRKKFVVVELRESGGLPSTLQNPVKLTTTCFLLFTVTRIHIKFLRPAAKRIQKQQRRHRRKPHHHHALDGSVNSITSSTTHSRNNGGGNMGGGLRKEFEGSSRDAGVDGYLYAPVYAGGRVLAASMLDALLFESHFNNAVLDIFKLFCGIRLKRDIDMDNLLGIEPSFLCYVKVPEDFVGRTFLQLYGELAINHGILPIGLLRQPDESLGNKLPFVFTNPLPSIVLKDTDLVYALTPVKAAE